MKKTCVSLKSKIVIIAIAALVSLAMGSAIQTEDAFAYTKTPAKFYIKKVAPGYTTAKIFWKKSKNAKKYRVYLYLKKNGKYRYAKSKLAKGSKCRFKKLKEGQFYKVKVKAVNRSKKRYSKAKIFKTKLSRVTGLTMTASKGTTATLKWHKKAGVSKYCIYVYSGGKWQLKRTSTSTTASLSNLKNGKIYSLRIRGKATNGRLGLYSRISKIVIFPKATAQEGAPATSSKIRLLADSQDDTLYLNWDSVWDENGEKMNAGYKVQRYIDSSNSWTTYGNTHCGERQSYSNYSKLGNIKKIEETYKNIGKNTTFKVTPCLYDDYGDIYALGTPVTAKVETKPCGVYYYEGDKSISFKENNVLINYEGENGGASIPIKMGDTWSNIQSSVGSVDATVKQGDCYIYFFDTNCKGSTGDFKTYLAVYTYKGKVVGWVTNQNKPITMDGKTYSNDVNFTLQPGNEDSDINFFTAGFTGYALQCAGNGFTLVLLTPPEDAIFYEGGNITAEELICENTINAIRASNGKYPLIHSDELYRGYAGAKDTVNDYAGGGGLGYNGVAHTTYGSIIPELKGKLFSDRTSLFYERFGKSVGFKATGENAAANNGVGGISFAIGWYNSVKHRAAMLASDKYTTHFAVTCANGNGNGFGGYGVTWFGYKYK